MTQMMNWCKLIDYQNDYITRGAVFRIPAQWPYEKVVDLLFYNPLEKDSGMGFLVVSGYKGGLIKQYLPKESEVDGKRDCVATSWLIENWSYWVYPECPVEDVWICDGYPVPTELPST